NVVQIVATPDGGATASVATTIDGSSPTAAQLLTSLTSITGLTSSNTTVAANADGSYTITIKGQTAIASLGATSVTGGLTAAVTSASNGTIQVAGNPGAGPFTISFGGTLAGANAFQIGATATDGTTATVTTVTEGSISAADVLANLNSIPVLSGNVQVAG